MLGLFDPTLAGLAWFDPDLTPLGKFDRDLSHFTAPEPEPVVIARRFGGETRHLDEAKEHFERQQDEWRDDLRDIIERAFIAVEGEVPSELEPAPVEVVRAVAIEARPEVSAVSDRSSLTEVMRLVRLYEAELIAMRRAEDDEEDFILLMAV